MRFRSIKLDGEAQRKLAESSTSAIRNPPIPLESFPREV